MLTTFCGPTSRMNCRIASRNGSPSMSPVVPPISVMTTSALLSSDTSRMRALDLVGDVRNHLHGFAEIIAAPLLQDHALVDLAAGQVVVAREDAIGEALVVAEIEIGLRAVIQDVNFAVLKRVHRPRIDVEIGIELLEDDAQAAQFEQRAERSRREAFA